MSNIKIYLAADHRGFQLKEKIKIWLKEWGYEYEDMGNFIYDKDDDYPDFISKAAEKVSQDPENSKAIILGGSGQGEAMVANRHKGVRAAVFYGPPFALWLKSYIFPSDLLFAAFSALVGWSRVSYEIIKLSREHNNANVLSLGTFFVRNDRTVKKAIKLWLETPFSGDERHVRRISKF